MAKYVGQKFGRLTVLEKIEGKGRAKYLVQCDCGTQKILVGNVFIHGKTKSCGCLKREIAKKSIENTYPIADKIHEQARIDGSSAIQLNQKKSKNSTSGFKGVSKMASGSYRAYINVARKQIHLGSFAKLQDAIDARKDAEDKYYKPILDKYEEIRELDHEN